MTQPVSRFYQDVDLNIEPNVYHFVKDRCHQFGDKIAVIDPRSDVQWSYTTLLARIEQLRVFFHRNGVSPGDRVGIYAFNGLETYSAILGLACLPATAVLIRPSFKYREAKSVLNLSQCSAVITDKDHLDTVLRIQDELKTVKTVIQIDDSARPYPSMARLLRAPVTKESASIEELDEALNRDLSETTVLMVPTSGTTGHPKLVEHTHRSFLSSFPIAVPNVGVINRDDVLITWVSLTHITGVWKIGGALHVGATLLVARFDDIPTYAEVHRICDLYKVTCFMIFPSMSRAILTNAVGEPTKSVTSIICAGSRPTPDLESLLRRWFPNLRQLRNLLGQTEAMIYVSITPNDEFDLRSIGYPPSNCELRLLDTDTGEQVAMGEIGEIVVRSPALMKGYFLNSLDTHDAFTEDGWLKTGDLGYQDPATGRYFFVDRIKEMIICKDNRLSPGELENVLVEHECVAEAAVIGVPHPAIGEAPAALVELKHGTRPTEQLRKELAALVESQLADYKVLYGGVHFVARLPRTELNKIARRKLRDLLPDAVVV